jgi:hypothetical protein
MRSTTFGAKGAGLMSDSAVVSTKGFDPGRVVFTAGPWIVHPALARVDCQKVSEKGGPLPVCQMLWPTDERSEDETEANAYLIAAAPELYAALVELKRSFWDEARVRWTAADFLRFAAVEQATAALAKARGGQ